MRVDRVAHLLTQSLDRIAGAARQQRRRRRVADVAGGANALLEQRELVVEAVRVEVAVRLAQAHREAPALAGAQGLARLDQRRVLVVAGIPAERERRRNAGRRAVAVDREAKAQPARPLLRQAGDDAGDDDVAPLDRGRQRLGEAQRRLPPGRREAGQRAGRDHHEERRDAGAPRARRIAATASGRQRDVDGERHQLALAQLQRDAGKPGKRQRHEPPAGARSSHREECRICLRRAASLPMSSIYDRLTDLDISLPPLAIPAGAYVPFVRSGNLIFLSGHIAKRDGKAWVGQLGRDMNTATGKKAARAVAIDLLGTLHAAVGDLDKIERIVRITSLVNSSADFIEHHLVTNGCSELFGEVFAEKGAHARSAYGVAQLPLGACVEIELIAQAAE